MKERIWQVISIDLDLNVWDIIKTKRVVPFSANGTIREFVWRPARGSYWDSITSKI